MVGMSKILPWRGKRDLAQQREEEPNPVWALAVGLVYVFRTAEGHKILRQLEDAVRHYAADPAALWRLVQRGEEVIDTTATTRDKKTLPSSDVE
jgi:hypothetical protein